MSTNFLFQAKSNRIGDHATFQTVGGNATTNIYNHERGDLVELCGNTFRRFPMGDIIVQKNVSSKVAEVTVAPRCQASVSSILRPPRPNVIKVRKIMQHVRLLGFPGAFTSVTIERVEGDREDFDEVMARLCRDMASRRSLLLTHLVGLGWSKQLTLIVNDELVNAEEYILKVGAENNRTLSFYVEYTQWTACSALRDDNPLAIPVFRTWKLWSFNTRTHGWQYDLSSVTISPPSYISLAPLTRFPVMLLRQDPRPLLHSDEVVAFFESQFRDFLHPIALSGAINYIMNLSDFVRHNFLTFGAVVDCNKPGIVAHLPLTQPPAWYFRSQNSDVKASYSISVPSRVDLSFRYGSPNEFRIHFFLRLLDPSRHQAAYLSQSLPFSDDCNEPNDDLVFIENIGFSLIGTFSHNPMTFPTPVYLFVPPIRIEELNGLYCVRYPLASTLFYWSLDPYGHSHIPPGEWETYGIPILKAFSWIGASWHGSHYEAVREHLQRKNVSLDGRQYARYYGYPELIHGDPHNPGIAEVKESYVEVMDCCEDVCISSKMVEYEGESPSFEYRHRSHSDVSITDNMMEID